MRFGKYKYNIGNNTIYWDISVWDDYWYIRQINCSGEREYVFIPKIIIEKMFKEAETEVLT